MDFIGLVWLIPLVMGLAALINGLGCRKLGEVAGYISVAAMASTFVLAVLIFLQVKGNPAIGHHGDGHGHASAVAAPVDADYGDVDHSHADDAITIAQNAFVPGHTEFRGGQGGYVHLWTWFDIPQVLGTEKHLKVEFAFFVDQLTSIFLLFISFVGTLVFIYATGYMREGHGRHAKLDEGYARFFCYLALFAMSMYILILGANFVVMFIGWEGVGLCSYLLIGYYFERRFSEKLMCSDAGKKAFVVNRVGDFGLLLGMGLLFWGLGTLDFQETITALTSGTVPAGFGYSGTIITAATLLLFLGATGKSAQIPLLVWLPDAMAGPTPVSALIHAATMVTAGVYMLARLNVLFMLSPTTLVVVAIFGAATALVAATIGLTQRGIKKILAYSTVSQLGYMFLAMGIGAFAAGIFHVFTHAFFKACLFLAAGSIIHALHHEEDVFKMGGLKSKMPKTWIAYLAATLAIAGVFPFAGFFSKDEILYLTYISGTTSTIHMVLWLVAVLTAVFTAFYMGRSLVLAFHGKTRMEHGDAHDHGHHHHDDHGHDHAHDHAHNDHAHKDDHAATEGHHDHHHVTYEQVKESSFSMTGVLLTLGVMSVIVGFLNVPKGLIPLGDNNALFHHFLAPVTDRGALFVSESIYATPASAWADTVKVGPQIAGAVEPTATLNPGYKGPELMLAIVSVILALGGLGFAFFLYGDGSLERGRKLARALQPLYNISWNAWWWDDLYDAVFVRGFMRLYAAVLAFDKLVIDGIVNGVGAVSRNMAMALRRLQNGQVQVYGLVMLLGVCVVLLYFALSLATVLGRVRHTHQTPAVPAATTSLVVPQQQGSGNEVAQINP